MKDQLTLTDVLEELPDLIGREATIRTLHRWFREGLHGRRLPSKIIAGRRMVDKKDLIAFAKPRENL